MTAAGRLGAPRRHRDGDIRSGKHRGRGEDEGGGAVRGDRRAGHAPRQGRVRLDLATWPEVEAYLGRSGGIVIPAGSTEQHGPMGLIGTDAICAERVAMGAADLTGAMVAPTLAYAPAPFNMAFAGTISVSEELFENLVSEILGGLVAHGFDRIYFVNGHGANLAPLQRTAAAFQGERGPRIRIRSW